MLSVRLVVIVLALVTLPACSRGPEDALDDYLARLTRALDVSAVDDVASVPLSPGPTRRTLALAEPELNINLLEYLSLSGCELGRVLGQRNSALGRVAPASQRLHSERDILQSLPDCIHQLTDTEPELAASLQAVLATKIQARMKYWWNGWMTSQEWQAFSSPAAPLLPYDEAAADELLSAARQATGFALRQGQAWQAKSFGYDSTAMETHQQQWLATEALGSWRRSQAALTEISRLAALQIDKRIGERPLCPAGRKTPQAEIVQTVFSRFYAAGLQPYLSRVDRYGDAVLADLRGLGELAEVTPEWDAWLASLAAEKAALRDAHLLHVRKWQVLLRQCGMMPGQDTSHPAPVHTE